MVTGKLAAVADILDKYNDKLHNAQTSLLAAANVTTVITMYYELQSTVSGVMYPRTSTELSIYHMSSITRQNLRHYCSRFCTIMYKIKNNNHSRTN